MSRAAKPAARSCLRDARDVVPSAVTMGSGRPSTLTMMLLRNSRVQWNLTMARGAFPIDVATRNFDRGRRQLEMDCSIN